MMQIIKSNLIVDTTTSSKDLPILNTMPSGALAQESLSIDKFIEMDYRAINEYYLPVELMMENAGHQLARFIIQYAHMKSRILLGIGPGNNGGGGLVAARRLAGWGYLVYLEIPDARLKSVPATQLDRALAYGVKIEAIDAPDIFVDAYFGFSQRLPLPPVFQHSLQTAMKGESVKISLDLPTGFDKNTGDSLFHPDYILTLAAPKTELIRSGMESEIYVADIGIPHQLYTDLGITQPPFGGEGFIKQSLIKRNTSINE